MRWCAGSSTGVSGLIEEVVVMVLWLPPSDLNENTSGSHSNRGGTRLLFNWMLCKVGKKEKEKRYRFSLWYYLYHHYLFNRINMEILHGHKWSVAAVFHRINFSNTQKVHEYDIFMYDLLSSWAVCYCNLTHTRRPVVTENNIRAKFTNRLHQCSMIWYMIHQGILTIK